MHWIRRREPCALEIDLDNSDQLLVPGVYANVKLGVSTATRNYVVPANTLLFRSEGLRIALVDAQNRVHLQPVTLGRDFGSTVEVTQGLEDNSRIVLNPSDSLAEGQQVKIADSNTQADKTKPDQAVNGK